MSNETEEKRSELWRLLGYPGGPSPAADAQVVGRRQAGDVSVTELLITTPISSIPTLHLAPPKQRETGKTVIYCHAHGHNYQIGKSEVLDGRSSLLSPPPGLAMVGAGHHVVCADMPCFGSRQGLDSEEAAAKAALWQGRTLFGQMLADQVAVIDAVQQSPLVPTDTLVSFGISMGATLAYWLAALDSRIAAAAHLCAFANIAPLIESGAHDLHASYLTVPGLLAQFDMGDVAAMIAPRPQFVATGATDPLTPSQAWEPAINRVAAEYRRHRASAALEAIREPNSGHCETARCRERVMAFIDNV